MQRPKVGSRRRILGCGKKVVLLGRLFFQGKVDSDALGNRCDNMGSCLIIPSLIVWSVVMTRILHSELFVPKSEGPKAGI